MELRRRWAIAGSAAFGSLLLSGPAVWAVDVCSLLTSTQAETALGVPDVNAGAGPNRCNWTSKKYVRGAGQLTVLLEGANDGAKMLSQGTAVNGVGDEAIQTVVGDGAVLHVRKGNMWLVVNVHGVPLDQAKQVEQTVAKLVVAKL
jgi:hypothetical protein